MSGWNWGSTSNNSNSNTSSSSWSWGSSGNSTSSNTNNTTNSWGSFGSTSNNNNNSSGGSSGWGSFGSSSNNNNNNNSGSSSSSGWGSWGSSGNSNNNNNNSSGSSFSWGSNNNNNSNNNSGSSFTWGSSSNNNNNNNSNNWGSNNNSNQNWNFNNNSNTNNNNNNQNNNNVNNPKDPKFIMQRIFNEYDAQSPNCRFEVILYNRVPPNQVGMVRPQKPLNVRAQLWDQFVADNPDKRHLVPSAMRGYEALNTRSSAALAAHTKIIKAYQVLGEGVDKIKVDIERMKDQIFALKRIQIDLSYRLLVVLKAYIVKSLKDETERQGKLVMAPLNASERKMQDLLEGLNNMSRDLQYKMAETDRLMAVCSETMLNPVVSEGTVDEDVLFDEKSMNAMFHCLSDDTKMIAHLAKTVQKDYDDLEIMRNGLDAKRRLLL